MTIHPYRTTDEMGAAAALHAARSIWSVAERQEFVPVVFATGTSQLATLRALTAMRDVPWMRVVGFHLDEYLGVSDQHPASFRHYLRTELTSRVPLHAFYEIDGTASDSHAFCERYAALLRENPPQLCLLGIGENGHLAFNDPSVADFDDPKDVKIAALDEACRTQQVNEGWFSALADVPVQAITVTIPAILRIPELILSVPGERKHAIVERTVCEDISTRCPATVLRTHPSAHLYLDAASNLDTTSNLL